MFTSITLRGTIGAIVWGYQDAATVSSWTITKSEGRWTLTATLSRLDAYQLRQRPLLFTAPRDRGRWCWPLQHLQVGERQLVATLGPPEQ